MADKMGSSSYQNGDCGGSAGDYHGVSSVWVAKKTKSGVANLKGKKGAARRDKFLSRMSDLERSANNKASLAAYQGKSRAAARANKRSVNAAAGWNNARRGR